MKIQHLNYFLIFLFIVMYSPFMIVGGLIYGVWAGLRGGWRTVEEWIEDWPIK